MRNMVKQGGEPDPLRPGWVLYELDDPAGKEPLTEADLAFVAASIRRLWPVEPSSNVA